MVSVVAIWFLRNQITFVVLDLNVQGFLEMISHRIAIYSQVLPPSPYMCLSKFLAPDIIQDYMVPTLLGRTHFQVDDSYYVDSSTAGWALLRLICCIWILGQLLVLLFQNMNWGL